MAMEHVLKEKTYSIWNMVYKVVFGHRASSTAMYWIRTAQRQDLLLAATDTLLADGDGILGTAGRAGFAKVHMMTPSDDCLPPIDRPTFKQLSDVHQLVPFDSLTLIGELARQSLVPSRTRPSSSPL